MVYMKHLILFLIKVEFNNGWLICRKCWCHVEIFHKFYLQIESIHRTLLPSAESIFTLTLDELNSSDCKSTLLVKAEKNSTDFPNLDRNVDVQPCELERYSIKICNAEQRIPRR